MEFWKYSVRVRAPGELFVTETETFKSSMEHCEGPSAFFWPELSDRLELPLLLPLLLPPLLPPEEFEELEFEEEEPESEEEL